MARLVTKALQDTLLQNPLIEKVYFTLAGEHYFNVFTHAGKQYGRIPTVQILKEGKKVDIKTPVLSTLIVETLSAKEVLELGNSDPKTIISAGGAPSAPVEKKFYAVNSNYEVTDKSLPVSEIDADADYLFKGSKADCAAWAEKNAPSTDPASDKKKGK